MAFVVFGAKPLGFLEESHRSQPPPLDGSIAEGMAVLCLLEALAGSNAPCDGSGLTLAKPSQGLRAIWSFTQGLGRDCESPWALLICGFSNQGRGE